MLTQEYRASLSRSQGRAGWCIIFRHPIKTASDGRSRLRVRRGLGTTDKEEAQSLVDQMNELLAHQELWSLASRDRASITYDERITNAFYDLLTTSARNSWSIRDEVIPLPGRTEGYVRCMMLGTTGAGKTTVVRQLIGTDPDRERFPSTASARTTVADIEIVTDDNPIFRGVVTFISRDETRVLIEESILSSVLAVAQERSDSDVIRKFLEHSEQRFRLSYLLGTLDPIRTKPIEEGDEWEDTPDDLSEIDYTSTTENSHTEGLLTKLHGYLAEVRTIATRCRAEIEGKVDHPLNSGSREDQEVMEELFEEELRDDESFQSLIDLVLDDVESRFEIVSQGEIILGSSRWPTHWTFETPDRSDFIRVINQFSSNYAPNFGKLLTPLVDGIRVVGPFKPTWASDLDVKLVLLDGEGLGHTADSAFTISTRVTRKYDMVDAIVLVDNAAIPMQAVPITVMRSIVSSGHEDKMILCFTHFDNVQGVNLPSMAAKQNHVLGSVDNALTSLSRTIGRGAELALRRLVETNVVFLAGIDRAITEQNLKGMMRYSANQFRNLLTLLNDRIKEPEPAQVYPIYDPTNLVLAIQKATQEFHAAWGLRLGLRVSAGYRKEHWASIKALARRLGELHQDEYGDLKPVAELQKLMVEHINLFLSVPVAWEPCSASEETMRSAITAITRQVTLRLLEFSTTKLFETKIPEWSNAYIRRGTGSTFLRARDIEAIFHNAVPVPGEVADPTAKAFLVEVHSLVGEALKMAGGRFQSYI